MSTCPGRSVTVLALLPLLWACNSGTDPVHASDTWPETAPSPAAIDAAERAQARAAPIGEHGAGGVASEPWQAPSPEAGTPGPEEPAPEPGPGDDDPEDSGGQPEPNPTPNTCRFNGNECAYFDGRWGSIHYHADAGSLGQEVTLWDPATSAPYATDIGHPGETVDLLAGTAFGNDWGVQVEGRDVETLGRIASWQGDHWLLQASALGPGAPCKFNGNACSVFDGTLGALTIHNDVGVAAVVVLWHPDSGTPYQEFPVDSGAAVGTGFSIGDDWGVQIDSAPVRTLDRVARYQEGGWVLRTSDLLLGYLPGTP